MKKPLLVVLVVVVAAAIALEIFRGVSGKSEKTVAARER